MRISLIYLACGALCLTRSFGACPSLNDRTLALISASVSTRFDLAPDINLEDQGLVNETCYRRMLVRSQEPKRLFSVFISPDQRFVFPDILDITVDRFEEKRREKDEISRLLEADVSPSRGPASALVTIVEFSDFQCPYCKELAGYLADLQKDHTTVRVVFKEFPLPQHTWAKEAAVVAACTGRQSKDAFWSIHDFLFSNQDKLSTDFLRAKTLEFLRGRSDINETYFSQCTDKPEDVLRSDYALAEEFHINQTPTIFINGARKVGLVSRENLRRIVERSVNSQR